MKTYSALIALGGDLLNTVPRTGLTVAELALLMAMHGKGAVTRVHREGEVEDVGHAALTKFLKLKWPACAKLIPDIVEQYGRLPTDISELELTAGQQQGDPIHANPRANQAPDQPSSLTVAPLPPVSVPTVRHDEPTNALGEDEGAVRGDDPFAPAEDEITQVAAK